MRFTTKNVVFASAAAMALTGCSALGLDGLFGNQSEEISAASFSDPNAVQQSIEFTEFNASPPVPVSPDSFTAPGTSGGFTVQEQNSTNGFVDVLTTPTGPDPLDTSAYVISDVPPNPLPGECYAQITLDPVYEAIDEQIILEEARTETRIIPAVFGDVQEEVVIREQSIEFVITPATYQTVTEEIVVRPEARRLIPVEPVYETVLEQVEILPARTVWKPGRGPIERIDNMTGEILCLVEEPAVYETVERRVMVSPATTREEIIPALTETVTREILDQPASVEERIVPAQTQLITRRVEVQPAREELVEIPALTRTIQRQTLVRQGRTEWRSILCETNTTPDIVRQIQTALNERGYSPGRIDGAMGPRTTSAVDAFQRANGMSGSGITMETLALLGINASNQSLANDQQ